MAQAVSGGGEAAPVWIGMISGAGFGYFWKLTSLCRRRSPGPSALPRKRKELEAASVTRHPRGWLALAHTAASQESQAPSPATVTARPHSSSRRLPRYSVPPGTALPNTDTVNQPWLTSWILKIARMQDEIAQKILCNFDFSPDRVPVRDKQDTCGILRQKAPPLNSVLPPELPRQPPHNPPLPPHLQVRNRRKFTK